MGGGDGARAHIDKLANKYTGADYSRPVPEGRIILKIAPDKINTPARLRG